MQSWVGREWRVERVDMGGVERKEKYDQNPLLSIIKEFIETSEGRQLSSYYTT